MLETDGMEAFVAHWMSLPLFRTQARLAPARLEQERARRLRNAPRSLAACLRGLGTGAQPSLWAALKDVQIPTRLLVGERDAKFRHIARDMADALPRASTHVVPGAGHATHLECPEAFVMAVRSFCGNTIEARGDPKHEDAVDARA
jgi:2-succinyl-6-hydroxy-2,4-cyclohexadiene-1-carboxylate synthase